MQEYNSPPEALYAWPRTLTPAKLNVILNDLTSGNGSISEENRLTPEEGAWLRALRQVAVGDKLTFVLWGPIVIGGATINALDAEAARAMDRTTNNGTDD